MPALTADDVKTLGKSTVEQEMRERLQDIKAIRERNDGSLANVKGEDTERVRQHNADLGFLGERLDGIKELETADLAAQRLEESLDTPAKGMRHPGAGDGDPAKKGKRDLRDAGAIFADSKGLKSYREDGIKGIEVEVPIGAFLPEYRELDLKGYQGRGRKDTLGETTNVDTQYPPESVRVGVLVEQLFQQPNISDLMPQATITQAAVPFMRETVNDTGAVETAEGALAPEASLEFTEDSAPVRKIPVILPVTEEILADEQLVRGHINNRLPQFVRMREDGQLLLGDGTGQNLQGILGLDGIDATTSYSMTDGADVSSAQAGLDAVFSATMRVAEAFLLADAAVMNLGIWEKIRLAKDKMGQYLIAPATEQATPRIWGLQITTNQNMPVEGNGNTPIVVGAFATASQIWRRQAVTLAVSDSHEDNFGRGILVVKATSRLAVTHYRPAGYAVVTSTT